MTDTFEHLGLRTETVNILKERNIHVPTPIQSTAIPLIRDGRDVMAQSQTGTGKTLAYLLPLLERIDPAAKRVQAAIVVPTRELGVQIVQEAESVGAGSGIHTLGLIGGASLQRQIDKLKLHPQLIVGTPGRIVELIRMRKLSMHHIRTIVVDEADQVFTLGSSVEIETIVKNTLRDRQLLFFSATFPQPIINAAHRLMRDPVHVDIEPQHRVATTVEHVYFVCDRRDKIDTLRRLARHYNPKSAIVFVNETDDVAEIVEKLRYTGLSVEALYGEARKQERATMLTAFRAGKFQLLICTDVAARGLDIAGVSHIINFDPPVDADHYVHRAGRTGRMGRSGTVVSIVTANEQFIIDKFASQLDIRFTRKTMYAGQILNWDKDRTAVEREQARGTVQNKPIQAGAAITDDVSPLDSSLAGKSTRDTALAKSSSGKQAQAVSPAKLPRAGADRNGTKPGRTGKNSSKDRKNKGAPKWLKEKRQQ